MSGRSDSPVRVVAEGENKALAVVPSSVLQASRMASEYATERPDAVLIIKRGEKVLGKVEPRKAKPGRAEAA